jgi:hypothetical protein
MRTRTIRYRNVALAGAPALALSALPSPAQNVPVRVATYNIQYLDTANSQDRFDAAVGAHVWALQEIDDRAALEKVFDPA